MPYSDLSQNIGSTISLWNAYGEIHTNGLYGTEDIDYGDILPDEINEGDLFFQISEDNLPEEPAINLGDIYPIGAIYMNTTLVDPATLFGGTWERIQDVFLLCAGSSYAAGSTGGAATQAHTHSQVARTSGGPSNNTSGSTAISVAQMPSHNHNSRSLTGYFDAALVDRNATISFTGICSASTPRERSWKYGEGDTCRKITIDASHTHTANGSGSGHTHTLNSHTHSVGATTTGGASNTNNMPPYLTIYAWKRTA